MTHLCLLSCNYNARVYDEGNQHSCYNAIYPSIAPLQGGPRSFPRPEFQLAGKGHRVAGTGLCAPISLAILRVQWQVQPTPFFVDYGDGATTLVPRSPTTLNGEHLTHDLTLLHFPGGAIWDRLPLSNQQPEAYSGCFSSLALSPHDPHPLSWFVNDVAAIHGLEHSATHYGDHSGHDITRSLTTGDTTLVVWPGSASDCLARPRSEFQVVGYGSTVLGRSLLNPIGLLSAQLNGKPQQ